MIASVSTNLNSIIITIQSKVCYYFKQRGTIDTQGRSLSLLTGDAQGCNETQTLPAASHFIRMRLLPFVLASTSLLLQKASLCPNILGDSDGSCKRHFWFKALNTILVAFLFFSFVSRQLKFITVITAERQIFSFNLSPCTRAVISRATLSLSCHWFAGRVDICYSSSCLLNPFLL